MARKSGLLWLVGLLSLSSCITFERYPIEVYKPSSYTFPAYVHTVGIVSRNLKYESDTLQSYHLSNGKLIRDPKIIDIDLLAKQICIDSLAYKLRLQNRFDSIFTIPADAFQEKKVKEIRPAINSWYQSLATRNKADALILLDMFSCFYKVDDNYQSPEVNVITSNIWSVYDTHAGKITDRHQQIDTLYWNGYDNNGNYRKIKLPEKKEAIKLAAAVIANDYAKHIIPGWTMVYREIMSNSNPDLQVASALAKKGDWDKAKAMWQEVSGNSNKKNRIIALYDLALASEMDGDTEKALDLCEQGTQESSGLFFKNINQAIKEYSAVLFKRKIELEKLKIQNENH